VHPLALATLVSALGGFLFGYDTAVISGAVGALKAFFRLDAAGEGLAASSAILGCIPGALMAGFLGDRFGRKKTLLFSAVCYAVSAVWSALPGSFAGFLAARILGGIGVGISSMVCPVYIAEMAPERLRGRLGALFQLGIVTGIGLVFFVNYRIQLQGDAAWNVATGWRWMLGSETLPAVVFLALLAFVTESPRWLAVNGRTEPARAILVRLVGADRADRELEAILRAAGQEEGRFRELFGRDYRRPLLIAVALALFCQLSGINAIMYYAPEVFKAAGSSTDSAFASSVWVGVVNLLFTFVAIGLVDKAGRRALLLVGSAVQVVALGFVGLMYHQGRSGAGLLAGILAFCAAFAMAMGPIPWILISEIFPGRIRGRAASVGVLMIWVGCYVVSQTFPLLKEGFGPAVTFWIYAACSLASLVFVAVWVPETKGRTLEEIAASWGGGARPASGSD
jgi:SP family arabinose:H+ symporter-like MFS transporter